LMEGADQTREAAALSPSLSDPMERMRQRQLDLLARFQEKQMGVMRRLETPTNEGAPMASDNRSPTPNSSQAGQSTSNIKNSETEKVEEDVCRVCRCEAESERPLYYPCKCAGSIKFVHEDCLIKWVDTSGIKKCELCGTEYNFSPVYSHDRPSGLPLNVLFAGALRGAFAFTLHALRLLVVAFVWALCVPIVSAMFWHFYFGSIGDVIQTMTTQKLMEELWLAGLALLGITLVVGLGVMSVVQWVISHLKDMEERRALALDHIPVQNEADGMRQQQQQPQQPGDQRAMPVELNNQEQVNEVDEDDDEEEVQEVNNGVDAEDDADDDFRDVALSEFFGITGPIMGIFEKSLVILCGVGGLLGVVAYLPCIVGSTVIEAALGMGVCYSCIAQCGGRFQCHRRCCHRRSSDNGSNKINDNHLGRIDDWLCRDRNIDIVGVGPRRNVSSFSFSSCARLPLVHVGLH